MWIYFAMPSNPVLATPAGTLLMGFNFTALAPTAPTTLIDVALTGGSPSGHTIIYDAFIPNTNITGSLAGVNVQITPAPAGFATLLAALMLGSRRGRLAVAPTDCC
jgi:hypothetical protein